MIKKIATGLLLSAAATAGNALEGIMIEHVSEQIAPSDVLQVVSSAFTKRKWVVVETGSDFVEGAISHNGYECSLVVRLEGSALHYSENAVATRAAKGPQGGRTKRIETTTPKRWINNLGADISEKLFMLQVSHKASTSRAEDPARTLRKLSELLEEGLISRDEYDIKRAEVIKRI